MAPMLGRENLYDYKEDNKYEGEEGDNYDEDDDGSGDDDGDNYKSRGQFNKFNLTNALKQVRSLYPESDYSTRLQPGNHSSSNNSESDEEYEQESESEDDYSSGFSSHEHFSSLTTLSDKQSERDYSSQQYLNDEISHYDINKIVNHIGGIDPNDSNLEEQFIRYRHLAIAVISGKAQVDPVTYKFTHVQVEEKAVTVNNNKEEAFVSNVLKHLNNHTLPTIEEEGIESEEKKKTTRKTIHSKSKFSKPYTKGFSMSKNDTILHNVYGGDRQAMENVDKEIEQFLCAGVEKYTLEHTALRNSIEQFLAEVMLAYDKMGDEAVLDIMRKYEHIRSTWPEEIVKWNKVLEESLRNGYLPDFDDPTKKTAREDKFAILRAQQIRQGMIAYASHNVRDQQEDQQRSTTTTLTKDQKQSSSSTQPSNQQRDASVTSKGLDISPEEGNIQSVLLQRYMNTSKETAQQAKNIGVAVASVVTPKRGSSSSKNKEKEELAALEAQSILDDCLHKSVIETKKVIGDEILTHFSKDLEKINQIEKDRAMALEMQTQMQEGEKWNVQSNGRNNKISHQAWHHPTDLPSPSWNRREHSRSQKRQKSNAFSYDPVVRHKDVLNSYPFTDRGQKNDARKFSGRTSAYSKVDDNAQIYMDFIHKEQSSMSQDMSNQTAGQSKNKSEYLDGARLQHLARSGGTTLGQTKFLSVIDEKNHKSKMNGEAIIPTANHAIKTNSDKNDLTVEEILVQEALGGQSSVEVTDPNGKNKRKRRESGNQSKEEREVESKEGDDSGSLT